MDSGKENTVQKTVDLIYQVTEVLAAGGYDPSKYAQVILPFTLLRRLDCLLQPTKEKVLAEAARLFGQDAFNAELLLSHAAEQNFYNTSSFDFLKLLKEPAEIFVNWQDYLNGFSFEVGKIMVCFNLKEISSSLNKTGLLYPVVSKFGEINLGSELLNNIAMRNVFEELIKRLPSDSETQARQYLSPESILLMQDILFSGDVVEFMDS